ncbi:protein-cysteine N-palmitoyltransferase HHAT-like [Argopecten irradians]|uniref:protein-cysteine N-palmitoyltransferase HHAT-like n=1 Tax=Argopecten irradians TaxID=31199 RepID=UPI0037166961
MYDFMKRYIYVPLGGSRGGITRQFLGSVLCFSFVYYWHGSEYYAFLWTVFNFIGVTVEAIGAKLMTLQKVKDIQADEFRIGYTSDVYWGDSWADSSRPKSSGKLII